MGVALRYSGAAVALKCRPTACLDWIRACHAPRQLSAMFSRSLASRLPCQLQDSIPESVLDTQCKDNLSTQTTFRLTLPLLTWEWPGVKKRPQRRSTKVNHSRVVWTGKIQKGLKQATSISSHIMMQQKEYSLRLLINSISTPLFKRRATLTRSQLCQTPARVSLDL